MCLYPKLINNRKYTATKKNGGIIPAINDKRTLLVPVGCGNCMECKRKKAREWKVRLNEEVRNNKNAIFVTLTFSNEAIKELDEAVNKLEEKLNTKSRGYNRDNAIAKLGVRRFLERWRKENKKSVRHWLTTELGGNGTENIHLHGIIWTDKTSEYINRVWKYGFTWLSNDKDVKGYVNERTINYVIKYVTKIDEKHKEYKSIILTSAGIGKGYINRFDAIQNKYEKGKTKEYYKTKQGIKLGLPIYYRNKIYSEEEREKLWIEKLDSKTRYVNGIKVSVKDGEEKYFKLLKEAQQKNKWLGYGDNSKNWEQKRYENELRNLKKLERIRNTKK